MRVKSSHKQVIKSAERVGRKKQKRTSQIVREMWETFTKQRHHSTGNMCFANCPEPRNAHTTVISGALFGPAHLLFSVTSWLEWQACTVGNNDHIT